MKHYTREQLQGIAADVFGRYPNARTVACTEDGVPFITDETEYPLKEHARVAGKYTGGLKIEYFRRCDMPAPETSAETETETETKTGTGRKTETEVKETQQAEMPENVPATSAPEAVKVTRKTGGKRKNNGKKAAEGKPAAGIAEAPAGETTTQAETLSPASPATETAASGGNNKLLKA